MLPFIYQEHVNVKLENITSSYNGSLWLLQSLLEEQISQVQENEVCRLRLVHMSAIPDTLYMVEERGPPPPSPCMPTGMPTIDNSGTVLGRCGGGDLCVP